MNVHFLIARGRIVVVLVVLSLWMISDRVTHGEETGKRQNVSFPELPRVALVRSKALEGDQEPAAYWAERIRAQIELSEKITTSLEKAGLQMKAANTILSRALEPATSAAVVGLSQPAESEKQRIQESLAQAEGLLQNAESLLKSELAPVPTDTAVEKPGDKPVPEAEKVEKTGLDRTQLLHTNETLRSFLDGMRAYLLDADPSSRRRAASALAPLLEDSDKRVSAAAKVWQALLRGNDASAALKILDNPMANPPTEAWPYAIHAKVLRCRYQGVQGSWSAALVMLTYLEEQLDEWVPQAADRGDARRLFAWTRLDVLKRWHEALPPEQEAERAWCIREAESVIKSYFGVEASLLRMEPSIPILLPDEPLKAESK